jgi:hypothetical protein
MLADGGWLRTQGMANRAADLQLAPSTHMSLCAVMIWCEVVDHWGR